MLKARAAPAFEHIKYLIRTKIEYNAADDVKCFH